MKTGSVADDATAGAYCEARFAISAGEVLQGGVLLFQFGDFVRQAVVSEGEESIRGRLDDFLDQIPPMSRQREHHLSGISAEELGNGMGEVVHLSSSGFA